MISAIMAVERLGKKYRIQHQRQGQRYVALRDVIAQKFAAPLRFLRRNPPSALRPLISTPASQEDFWALKDVSFEVKQGEVVGIIGRNGAGKSTLLKILSRITEPTEGRIRIRGRVASLLEVGTGFHPELTGRENIFLNGAILGMHRTEIKQKFDEIVAFAEVEKFLDTPVKRYSSGMYVRLAFAVAAHLEPEILIVDEVLAVGDAEFQKKCLGKMESVSRNEGRTVLFVSHNMGAVETLCKRGVLMQKGTLVFDGEVRHAISKYLAALERPIHLDLEKETDRSGNGRVRLRKVSLLTDGQRTLETVSGAEVQFEFAYANPQKLRNAQVTFTIYSENGIALTNIHSSMLGEKIILQPDVGVVTCCLPRLALNNGRYRVAVAIQDENGENYDHVSSALWFEVAGSRFYANGKSADSHYSLVLTDHYWR
jgi:homopolymeric O-antigen transport system ATP-binding protein